MIKSSRRFLLLLLISAFSFSAFQVSSAADLTVTAANVVASASASRSLGTAGATITAGQTVYLDTGTNTWKLADANLSAAAAKTGGIALNGAATGQPLAICTGDPSFTPGATVAVGTVYVQSATAGGIAPASDLATGMYTQFLFIGKTSTTCVFQIVRSDVAVP